MCKTNLSIVRKLLLRTALCGPAFLLLALLRPAAAQLPLQTEEPVPQQQIPFVVLGADSLSSPVLEELSDTLPPKRNAWQRFIGYFADANKEKQEKKFDFSVIGGPHYSNDAKFGIGLVASGLYRMDRSDTITQPSNVALYGSITTSGFYVIGIRGTNLFPQDRYRMSYVVSFSSFPSLFWGIGYENGRNDDNESKYTRKQVRFEGDFLFRLADNLYLGPKASVNYIRGKSIQRPELLQGQDESFTSVGIGGTFVYDTRDFIPNAYRGVYLMLEHRIFPTFFGNRHTFSRSELIFDWYKQVWKSGVLAFDFHTELNYGTVPWTMLATMGGSYRMRGYYEGRYRDNNLSEVQVELRQRIWRRIGATVWAGAGNVYSDFGKFRWKNTLPNYGVGFRWEFKNRVNVRLDYGFGKGQSGFIFQINEAF